MRKIYFLVLVLIGVVVMSNSIYAQSIDKHYISKPQPTGAIYFLFPTELFKSKADGVFIYDVTYNEKTDGLATINFTYEKPELNDADSISISYNNRVFVSGKPSRIYVEYKDDNWVHRYTFSTHLDDLFKLYSADITPEVTLYSKGQPFAKYSVISGKWRKYTPIGRKIIEVIRANSPK